MADIHEALTNAKGGEGISRDHLDMILPVAYAEWRKSKPAEPYHPQEPRLADIRGLARIAPSHQEYIAKDADDIVEKFRAVLGKMNAAVIETRDNKPALELRPGSIESGSVESIRMRSAVPGIIYTRFPGIIDAVPELIAMAEAQMNESIKHFPYEDNVAGKRGGPMLQGRWDGACWVDSKRRFHLFPYEAPDDQAGLGNPLRIVSKTGYEHLVDLKTEQIVDGRPMRYIRLPTPTAGTLADYHHDTSDMYESLKHAEAYRADDFTIVTLGRAYESPAVEILRFAESSPHPSVYKDNHGVAVASGWAVGVGNGLTGLEIIRDRLLDIMEEQGLERKITIKAMIDARTEAVFNVTDRKGYINTGGSKGWHLPPGFHDVNKLIERRRNLGETYGFHILDPVIIQPYVPSLTLEQLEYLFPGDRLAREMGDTTKEDRFVRTGKGETVPVSQRRGRDGEELDDLGRASAIWDNKPPVRGNEGEMYPYFRFNAKLVGKGRRARYKVYAATMTVCSSPIGHGTNASFNVKIAIPGLEKCRRTPRPDPYEELPVVFLRNHHGDTVATARMRKTDLSKLTAENRVTKSHHDYLPSSPIVNESDLVRIEIFDRRLIPDHPNALAVTRNDELVVKLALASAGLDAQSQRTDVAQAMEMAMAQ